MPLHCVGLQLATSNKLHVKFRPFHKYHKFISSEHFLAHANLESFKSLVAANASMLMLPKLAKLSSQSFAWTCKVSWDDTFANNTHNKPDATVVY